MTRWFRHYAGMMADPKFGGVARRCKRSRAEVLFVWGCLLEGAAEHGSDAYTWDADAVADLLGIDTEDARSIHNELEQSGLVREGRICRWNERQFTSDSSTERSRKHREAMRNGDATLQQQHATPPETESETEKKKERTLPAKAGGAGSDFEEFWKAYPRSRNMSKSDALRAWKVLESGGKLPSIADLLKAISSYKTFLAAESRKRGSAYPAKHAQGWLTGRRWEGFLEQKSAAETTKHVRDWADDLPEWASFKAAMEPAKWAVWFADMRPNGSIYTLIANSSFNAQRVMSDFGALMLAHFGREIEIKSGKSATPHPTGERE